LNVGGGGGFRKGPPRLGLAGRRARRRRAARWDIFYLAVADPAMTAKLLTEGLADTESAGFPDWNPSFDYLGYGINESTPTQKYFAVLLSGTMAGRPIPLPTPSNVPPGTLPFSWIARSRALVTWNAAASGLVQFDLMQASPQPTPLVEIEGGEVSAYALSSDGAALAYGGFATMGVISLPDGSRRSSMPVAPTSVNLVQQLRWSPDSKFLALMTRTNVPTYDVLLMRVDGVNTSSAIFVTGETSISGITFAWQR
jgi:hypothetical protein